MLTQKKRKRLIEIPPYIDPLPGQAKEVVRHLLDNVKPAQVYLIPGDSATSEFPHMRQSVQRLVQDAISVGAEAAPGPTER